MDWMLFSSSSVFVKGKFHWTTNTRDYNECEIISFGLADENVGKVEQPYYGEGKRISELGVLGCDLCGFSHHLTIGVDVWIMKEYGVKESWTKMCTIEYLS
ncbi:hypothetical protein KY285_024136 [Solanum tuberosum]|nr:hypothetical protein KY285_024136 [Solanum tuberosum]